MRTERCRIPFLLAVFVIAALAPRAYAQTATTPTAPEEKPEDELSALKSKVADLEDAMTDLKQQVADQTDRIQKLEEEVQTLQQKPDQNGAESQAATLAPKQAQPAHRFVVRPASAQKKISPTHRRQRVDRAMDGA